MADMLVVWYDDNVWDALFGFSIRHTVLTGIDHILKLVW